MTAIVGILNKHAVAIAAEIQKQIEEHTKMNSLCQPQSK